MPKGLDDRPFRRASRLCRVWAAFFGQRIGVNESFDLVAARLRGPLAKQVLPRPQRLGTLPCVNACFPPRVDGGPQWVGSAWPADRAADVRLVPSAAQRREIVNVCLGERASSSGGWPMAAVLCRNRTSAGRTSGRSDVRKWSRPQVRGCAEQRSLGLPASGLPVSRSASSTTRPEPDGQSAPAYPRSQGVVGPAGYVVPVADKGPMPRVQRDFQLLRGHHSLGSGA